MAALFDPTQAIFVDHSVYELKALISTAVESQEDKNVMIAFMNNFSGIINLF